ncbi:unnamed protein product [Lactuca virosa]|uniref:Zinc finger GRF-type domain-containing protein n=1 Tax=Lactuca virosa TaxID=75947 RepID=A0AAU9NDF6_9ASTR|nr:unnamed protein product [Lactuca virosa]
MASSSTGSTGSSTSTWKNVHGNFRNKNNPMVLCRCGVEASFSVVWMDKNPGRKFRGCTNFKEVDVDDEACVDHGHAICSDVGNWDCIAGEGLGS